VPELTFEDRETEKFIRMQAEHTHKLQSDIQADGDLEQWVLAGNWDFLERRVFADFDKEALATIKNPAFDPANLSQVAQLKALCQVMDLIRVRVTSRVQAVKDARTKLVDLERDLERSTLPEEGE